MTLYLKISFLVTEGKSLLLRTALLIRFSLLRWGKNGGDGKACLLSWLQNRSFRAKNLIQTVRGKKVYFCALVLAKIGDKEYSWICLVVLVVLRFMQLGSINLVFPTRQL